VVLAIFICLEEHCAGGNKGGIGGVVGTTGQGPVGGLGQSESSTRGRSDGVMEGEPEVLGVRGPASSYTSHIVVVEHHALARAASLLLQRARLAGSYGDESVESTHAIKHEQNSGHISVDDCARLRQILWQDPTPSNTSTPPTSSPTNPLEDEPYTPRRRSVSFSVPSQTKREDSGELERERAFRLHPARFTPDDNSSANSSESSLSSVTPTKPAIKPYTPSIFFNQPIIPPTHTASKPQPAAVKSQPSVRKQTIKATFMADTVKSVPLFYGDYGENENPSAWFAQFELSLPISWTDTQRIQRFAMQLTPGEAAAEWYQGLTSSHLSSFTSLKAEFFKRWPAPKKPKLTRAQQKERIMAQILKEEDVGEWTQEGRTGNYAHVLWAINISRLALGMGDVDGAMIEYALESIPNLLKDHLKCTYNTWDEFVEDIQNVPNVKLKRGREDLNKERARDAEIARLKAQSTLSTSYLSQQLTQMSMGAQQIPSPTYRTMTRLPGANSILPLAPVTAMPISSSNSGLQAARGGPPSYNSNRGSFIPRMQLTRAQIMERATLVPQRPNTEAGTRQYEMDIDAWHRAYGAQGTPSLERLYPLRPGTAVLGSGECYNCGTVTEPTHLSMQCTTTNPLRPHETRWRQQIAGLLRRAVPQQAVQTPYPTPVQHVMTTNYSYQQPYGNLQPAPVYAIGPQEESSWGDQNDTWGVPEPGYDWTPENYGGPLPALDQQ
jgi:hypothetical protein